MGKAFIAATVVAYGAAAHFAAATGTTRPALGLLLLLALTGATTSWRRRSGATLLFLAAAAALLGFIASGRGLDALYLPPIAINTMIFWAFARSLAAGRTPLITLFARLIDGELDEATLRYTRSATRWWTIFLALLLADNLALAWWAPREVWSTFAHFINYLLLGGFFALEYLLRRHFLPERTRGGFVAFIRNLARIDLRAVLRQGS